MTALGFLAMPFRFTSVVFVALSSLVLGLVWGSGNFATQLIGLLGTLIILSWLTAYAFQFLDDAANGVRETAVLSAEMANPLHEPRSWVHPGLAVALLLVHALRPALPVLPSLVAAALLFPPSIAATVLSGRARDALNPLAVWSVIRDLGPWYALAVLLCAACAGLGAWLSRALQPGWLLFAALEMLLLTAYAGIGGVVYQRRIELGFAARISPERDAERAEAERDRQRQRMIDEVYVQVRGAHPDSAIAVAAAWLRGAPAHRLREDVTELLARGRQWREPVRFASVMRGLVPVLTGMRQHSLAREVEADAARLAAAREPHSLQRGDAG